MDHFEVTVVALIAILIIALLFFRELWKHEV